MRIVVTNHENADFQRLVAMLDDEYYQLFGDVVLQYRQQNKTDNLSRVALVTHNDRAVACGAFRKYDAKTVEIKRVFVQKNYRRQGLAIRVMHTLEDIARQDEFSKAILETGREMPAAIALYQFLGYTFIDNFGAFTGDEKVVCMQKAL